MQVKEWAMKHPHTGSRKDYWPHVFNNVNEGIPGFAYQLRLKMYFVGKGTYMFPHRPLPAIFSINIGFTLVVLPLLVAVFLRMMTQVNPWGRAGIIFFVSLLAPIFEKLAEVGGIFIHSEKWSHLYTFFGYLVFLTVIYWFFHWTKTKAEA